MYVQRRERTHKDHQSYKLRVGAFSALACDDVPLLRRTDNDLRRHYLLLVQLVIARQLIYLNTVRAKTLNSTPRTLTLNNPLPSNRHHRSNGDCLEGKRENYQVFSVQYCVQQNFVHSAMHTHT